ncbi:hypothetical protein [Caulobacter sp. 17J65-9]|uniref:hypothetical protein n=1 Tax=Caulobacter sp. 17J65-9 TaxID=2709382 RepID=UPI0013C94E7E|nr:hypothetical protein [Caulobacter sp. 17J65-9]NEX92218.1 hypothetical protein [Caulobacter sp. 17J65-9]
MKGWFAALAAVVFLTAGSPAQALCSYRGALDAKTTLEQEFRDSRYVVRARVRSAESHWPDDASDDDPWTLYRLEVVESFKGDLPHGFTVFTERNSGGFYMDDPKSGRGPDLGGEYLLFLNPSPYGPNHPPVAKQSFWVNYNCGQSQRWTELSSNEIRRLRALSTRK